MLGLQAPGTVSTIPAGLFTRLVPPATPVARWSNNAVRPLPFVESGLNSWAGLWFSELVGEVQGGGGDSQGAAQAADFVEGGADQGGPVAVGVGPGGEMDLGVV